MADWREGTCALPVLLHLMEAGHWVGYEAAKGQPSPERCRELGGGSASAAAGSHGQRSALVVKCTNGKCTSGAGSPQGAAQAHSGHSSNPG